jgi:aryl-alcohol dehydrogenase-like predicted oxidoreductase
MGVAAALCASCTKEEPTPVPVNSSAPLEKPQPTDEVPLRKLGRTGVNVSALGVGGAHLGKTKDEAESIRIVRMAIDAGITFLDNCWDYNGGESESRMGKALRDGYRKRAFLMTKLDARVGKVARQQLEQSLKRLETDMIDLVQIHEVIRKTDPERCFADDGIVNELIAAKKRGQIRFIGFTGHKSPDIHLAMLQAADERRFEFDTVQMPLNPMDAHYESFEKKVLPVLVAKGIGLIGMKSMGSGELLKSGVMKPEECLRYALGLDTSVVVSGMESVEVFEKNLAIVRGYRPFTPKEKEELLARTKDSSRNGKYELFKTSEEFDGTTKNPHWLEEARL